MGEVVNTDLLVIKKVSELNNDSNPNDILAADENGNLVRTSYTTLKNAIVTGAREATPDTVPTGWVDGDPDLFERYVVSTAGTYSHFIQADTNPVEVTADDLKENFVEIWVTNGVSEKILSLKPSVSLETQFDTDDNINGSTSNAIYRHYEGYTETTSGANALETVFTDLTGSLPVSAGIVYMFKDTRTETEIFDQIKIKVGTAGKFTLEKYELSSGVLTRVAYQLLNADLTVGENTITLTNNGAGGDMRTFATNQYLGLRANTGTLLARISYLTPATPTGYQFAIVTTSGTSFSEPTWRSDYRLAVELLGVSETIVHPGVIETIVNESSGSSETIDNLFSFNDGSIFPSLSKNIKPLSTIYISGDSLWANAIGGTIPNVETSFSERPMRLGESNNLARRLYDLLSWNKPIWRRLDNSAWTKSGTWSAINTTSIFEPVYANERYTTSSTANAYAEITVPDGMENFAIIVREGASSGILNFTLNGATMPSVNGVSTYDTNYAAIGHTGNPYKIIEFHNLPAGANVIRISKDSSTTPVYVWGGFWWTGNTLVVMNTAHGGHNITDLIDNHTQDEIVRNNPDAVIQGLPEMNEMRKRDIPASVTSLKTLLDNYLKDRDLLLMSCNILGTDPSDGTPNYYLTDATGVSWAFTQKELNLEFKKVVYQYKLPFIDIFKIFELKTLAKGGTLENGDAGIFWTTDGQHGNELGVSEWFNSLVPALKNTVLYNS